MKTSRVLLALRRPYRRLRFALAIVGAATLASLIWVWLNLYLWPEGL